MRIVAIILIVLGIAGLIHRGFTMTTNEEKVSVGPLSVRVEKQEHVAIPVWVSTTGIVLGAALLYAGAQRKIA